MQRVADLAEDIAELRGLRGDDHHRLRSVEQAVALMIETHKTAREQERRQYDQLAMRLTITGVLIAVATFALAVVVAIHTGK